MAHVPRISVVQFTLVLTAANSPAAAENPGQLYSICRQSHLDPAIALAFFGHESSFGLEGQAIRTKNWGNIRKGQGRHIVNKGGMAYYANWTDSLVDWCSLINRLYIQAWKRTTVPAVLDKYAPPEDHNDPTSYAAAVAAFITRWQLEDPAHGK
jgi:hypothetical protein